MTQVKKADGYFHQRVGTKGGITVGWYRDYDEQRFVFSFAVCHNDDLYNKKTGRDLVDERLFSDHKLNVVMTIDNFKAHLSHVLEAQDVVESVVIQQMLDEIQFADIKTKALVECADQFSSVYLEHGTHVNIQEMLA